MTERIAAAAILYHGHIVSLDPPARHPNIIWWIEDYDHTGVQGFITDTGRFVDRAEGYDIAAASGQIVHKSGQPDVPRLYTEDMW